MSSELLDAPFPTAWTSRPLRSMFRRSKNTGHPEEQMLSVYRDHGVVLKDGRTDNFNKTAENRNIYQLVDSGWLIVNRMKAWQGSLGISSHRGIVSGHYICFSPNHSEEPRYLNYLLRSAPYTAALRRASRGVRPSQIEIDNDLLGSLPVRLPAGADQRRIADYLDVEVARIDELIAVKQEMVTSVEQRLRSDITARLTEVVPRLPLKRSWRVIDCKHRTPTYRGTGYPVMSPGDITVGRIDITRAHRFVDQADYSDLADAAHRPKRGDIIYSRNASIGIASYVDTDEQFCMGQDVCLITSHGENQLYLMYVLNTIGLDQLDRQKIGSTFNRVNVSQILGLDVPTPSRDVQDRLAREFDRRASDTSALTRTLTEQIELLRERRRSLITAVVTGEMEVG